MSGVSSQCCKANESTCAQIEQSLEANVKIFQSNMQTLDERMAKLLGSKA